MNSVAEKKSTSPFADIVIIGSGIAGLCSAWRLSQTKRFSRIIVVSDPHDGGASILGTGLSLVKGHRIPRDPLFKLKYQGHIYLKTLLQEFSAKNPEFKFFEGVFEPFTSGKEYAEITSRVFSGQFQTPFDLKLMGRNDFTENFSFSKSTKGSWFYPEDIFFDLRLLLQSMRKTLESDPTISFLKDRVEAISLLGSPESRFFELSLRSSVLSSRFLVLCAGAGVFDLLKMLKLDPSFFQLAESPGRCFEFSEKTQKKVNRAVTFKDGNALCFSKEMLVYGKIFDQEKESQVQETLKHYLEMSDWEFCSTKSAIRVRSKKRLPVCEPLKLPGLSKANQAFLVSGLYRNGVQLADLLARQLVIHVIHEKDKLNA